MAKRFMVGDRVSVRETQATGAQKRPPVYSYGTIVERTPDLPLLSVGFHYVLLDGSTKPRMSYVGRMHHLDDTPRRKRKAGDA